MPKSIDRYQYLQERAQELGITPNSYLAEQLGMSHQSLMSRLAAEDDPKHIAWRLPEMWGVMKLLREPPENLYLVFPPDGEPPKRWPAPKLPVTASGSQLCITLPEGAAEEVLTGLLDRLAAGQ